MERLRLGLIGWGTVGGALGELIGTGLLPIDLAMVAVQDREKPRARPLPDGVAVATPEDVVDGAEVVVELAGGVEGPMRWATTTLEHGRPYVTANKALLATHGGGLARIAERTGAALLAGASVGGGTPMIETVAHLARSGAISRLRGLVNATTTFILSSMADGRTYDEALRAAQDAGFAEADPAFDVEGRDAAQKLAILASVAWGSWRSEAEVDTIGIVDVPVAAGETVRLVAEATPDGMTVRPSRLEASDRLASASGVESVLEVEMRDSDPVRVSGPGAGGRATAGAVYADLARLVDGERPILFGARP
jgi:homoserine dehydrogenase